MYVFDLKPLHKLHLFDKNQAQFYVDFRFDFKFGIHRFLTTNLKNLLGVRDKDRVG